MKIYARIIFCVVLLLIGLQWVGDPVEARLTGDLTAPDGWHGLDNNGPDNSHHFGATTLRDTVLLPIAVMMAGPAFFGYLLPSADSSKPQPLAICHHVPRAPPAA